LSANFGVGAAEVVDFGAKLAQFGVAFEELSRFSAETSTETLVFHTID
jgi:hypothetical protein